MKPHWASLNLLTRLLTYMLKSADPDGIELRFFNNPTVVRTNKSRKILDTLSTLKPEGRTDFHVTIAPLFERFASAAEMDVKRSRGVPRSKQTLRPTSVYIFTDGKCLHDVYDIAETFKQVSQRLQAANFGPTHIAAQFITFGQDAEALNRLQSLDEALESSIQ